MTAQVVRLRSSVARLTCSVCGAGAEAACDCGAPYVPAGKRAAAAVKANPGKSDRAIAADIGVSDTTVLRARKRTASREAVGERVGLDGKARKLPTRTTTIESDIEDEIDGEDPENYRTAFLLRVDQAIRFAAYSGPKSKDLAAAARRVAAAWTSLARKMEKSS